jgi:hypothetical protein
LSGDEALGKKLSSNRLGSQECHTERLLQIHRQGATLGADASHGGEPSIFNGSGDAGRGADEFHERGMTHQ